MNPDIYAIWKNMAATNMIPNTMKASGKPNLQETTLRIHKPKAVSVTSSDWPVRICPPKAMYRSQGPGYGYAFIYSTPKLYNLYVNNGDTKRFNWSIAPFEYKEAGGKNTGVTHREFEQGKLAEVMSTIRSATRNLPVRR